MKRLFTILSLILVAAVASTAQPAAQFTPDSLTRALWHFNELTGSVVHDTALSNNGTAFGTTIATGRFGNARSFNGAGDYVLFPSSTAFDFDTSGFRIDVWFKTTQQSAVILRRGLTPDPGFMISMLNGHIVGMIGTTPGSFPDALLSDSSTARYDDGAWHLATLVRDRVLRKLLLYVDGVIAGAPSDDNFSIPLNSSRPLTIGRWENDIYPSYFAGTIDEVQITTLPAQGVAIFVQPAVLDFGWVPAHTSDTLSLKVKNLGFRDSLRISSISIDNPLFGVSAGPIVIPSNGSRTIPVWYSPGAAKAIGDTTILRIASNDPVTPQTVVLVYGFGYAPNPPGSAFNPDSLTRGLWHFNETSGSIVHDTAAGLDGTVYGTTIIPGRFGNGRLFNGNGDYVKVPSNTILDFDTSSFTVDVWFKTTQASGVIVRRGLAPDPGFMISTLNGHVVGMIGTGSNLPWPNALLSDTSRATYDDDAWHIATMVRDRSARKLFLYVDGIMAGNPAIDNFTIPLNSNRPLTIGEWENTSYASYFAGAIDEVRLTSPKLVRFPIIIGVRPVQLDYGWARVSSKDTLTIQMANSGYRDSLRVTAVTCNNPRFSGPAVPFAVGPGSSLAVPIVYTPTSSQIDTGTISITSNDPKSPKVSIAVTGQGFAPSDNPTILSITKIPYSYNQARLTWVRSKYDTAIANSVTQYSIWHRIPFTGSSSPGGQGRPDTVLSPSVAWEFIEALPAIGVDVYAYVLQLPTSNIGQNSWEVYTIVAQTKSLTTYMSPPDSVASVRITGTTGSAGAQVPGELTLSQNYPNPFNPSTTIRYGLPGKSTVSLSVYNALGQAVATLVNGTQEAGYHEVQFDGSNLASGVYFYRLQAGTYVETKKLLLLR